MNWSKCFLFTVLNVKHKKGPVQSVRRVSLQFEIFITEAIPEIHESDLF